MRLFNTKLHGVADYLVGLALAAAPFLFGFATGGAAMWVPIAIGVAIIAYSLFTAYELGAVRNLSIPLHLWLDAGAGLFLAASPWLFSFDQRVWQPHLFGGVGLLVIASLTDTIPGFERRRNR